MPADTLYVERRPQGLLLAIKVVPGASRSKIVGVLDHSLKVAVAAPAEKGKANQALLKLLAHTLAVPRKSLTLHHGAGSPHKVLLIEGVDATELQQRLGFSVTVR